MSSDATNTFQKAYEQLKNIADKLKQDEVEDVDVLLKHVEQAADSYKICKARLDAAEKRLHAIFEETKAADSENRAVSSEPPVVTKDDDAITF